MLLIFHRASQLLAAYLLLLPLAQVINHQTGCAMRRLYFSTCRHWAHLLSLQLKYVRLTLLLFVLDHLSKDLPVVDKELPVSFLVNVFPRSNFATKPKCLLDSSTMFSIRQAQP